MRFPTTLISALIVSASLSGCFGDGGTGQGTEFDGTWTVTYVNPADIPAAGTGQTVTCNQPAVTMTITNGTGSTTQTLTCTITDPAAPTTNPSFYYLISVAINSVGDVNAIVNGAPLSGTCISTIGCSAHTSTTSLSLTR